MTPHFSLIHSTREMNNTYIPERLREPIPLVSHLPGIDPNAKYTYKNVFFGADREYADDEGWIKVTRHKRPNKNRKKKSQE